MFAPSRDRPATIELGCRGNKRDPRAIGVDALAGDGVDVVVDATSYLESLPDQSVTRIHSRHFLEHLADVPALLRESGRVLVDRGAFAATVPHWSNAYYWSDPTHRTPFGLYTFCYFARSDGLFKRTVPMYDFDFGLQLDTVKLGFKAQPPFYGRHYFRKAVGLIVNAHRSTQEFYEDNLAGIVSCYEIHFGLHRIPRVSSSDLPRAV